MKKLLFLLLLLPFLGNSQATFTAPVGYNTGVPSATPSGVGTRWRFDLLTGKKYTWLPGTLSWDEDARGIDQVAGCSAPLYTPGYNQSTFAVNSCTVPELYQYTGSAWECLNCVDELTLTAGSGITLSGTAPDITISNSAPDISISLTEGDGIDVTGTYPNFTVTNTSPNVVQTLSIAGQDLTLSNGGGTVTIPGGSSLGVGFTDGGGSGTIPGGTVAGISGGGVQFLGQAPFFIFTDNGGGSGANVEIIQEGIINMSVYDDRGSSLTMALSPSDGSFTALESNLLFKAGDNQSSISFNMNDLAALSFDAAANTVRFSDMRGTPIGIEYAAEYPDILTNDRSIPDVGLTKTLIASEGWSWPLLAPDGSAAAPSYSFSNSAETGIFYNNALLVASAPQGAVNARNIEIKSGSGTSGNGGAVLINAGNSSGRGGGQVSVTAGNSSGRNGGQINFRAGDTDTQTGGAVTLQSGNGATGGNYNMIAGSGTGGNGGTFYFVGGNSAAALGGNIEFVAGNGVDQSKNGDIIFAGNQAVLPLLTISQRDNISVKKIGGTIYCTDCTATDSSTGVQQVYNGSTWKNAW